MGEKRYTGSCHCGKVRYHVDLDLEQPVITCNCSMCGRSGTMLAFVPKDRFALEQGREAMTDYQFNRKVIHHLFCSTCGIKAFAEGISPDGSATAAINVRCLEGVDPAKVQLHHFDGASR